MLGEQLSQIGEFIMWNTDGSEIIIPRDKEDEYHRICDEWCKLTGIELEHDEYETMWVRDVNNYIAKFTNGKVKRKGLFAVYDDYIGNWDKNPSGLIISEAIQAFFLEGKDPVETITNWNNIHDFLYGMKGSRSFSYLMVHIQDDSIKNITEHTERAIRYYHSAEGGSLIKYWKKGKKAERGIPFESAPGTKLEKVKLLMNTPDRAGEIFRKRVTILEPAEYQLDEKGKRRRVKDSVREITFENKYPDLDYDYYIREAWRWIRVVQNEPHEEEIENLKIEL